VAVLFRVYEEECLIVSVVKVRNHHRTAQAAAESIPNLGLFLRSPRTGWHPERDSEDIRRRFRGNVFPPLLVVTVTSPVVANSALLLIADTLNSREHLRGREHIAGGRVEKNVDAGRAVYGVVDLVRLRAGESNVRRIGPVGRWRTQQSPRAGWWKRRDSSREVPSPPDWSWC
jgi:hypothetical protein